MKLGTSVRFLFPTSPATHERFQSLVASMPKGAFIERPMGAYTPEEQARNLMEVAAAERKTAISCPGVVVERALISAAYDGKARGAAIGTWSAFSAITAAIASRSSSRWSS